MQLSSDPYSPACVRVEITSARAAPNTDSECLSLCAADRNMVINVRTSEGHREGHAV